MKTLYTLDEMTRRMLRNRGIENENIDEELNRLNNTELLRLMSQALIAILDEPIL